MDFADVFGVLFVGVVAPALIAGCEVVDAVVHLSKGLECEEVKTYVVALHDAHLQHGRVNTADMCPCLTGRYVPAAHQCISSLEPVEYPGDAPDGGADPSLVCPLPDNRGRMGRFHNRRTERCQHAIATDSDAVRQ